MISIAAPLTALISLANPSAGDAIGDAYELRLNRTTSRESDRSSGSSRSSYVLIERVVDVYAGGVELEFDLPDDTTPEERAREWQFPVRVAKVGDASFELLNETEIAARIDDWLRLGGLTRESCGQWFFTWTVMKVECDPLSVLQILRPFDLGRDSLANGSIVNDPRALEPGVVESVTDDGLTALVASMPVDPEAVRRAEAEQNRITAEIMGMAANDEGDDEGIATASGNIEITFTLDPTETLIRRERMETVTVTMTDGVTERRATTEIITKEPLRP